MALLPICLLVVYGHGGPFTSYSLWRCHNTTIPNILSMIIATDAGVGNVHVNPRFVHTDVGKIRNNNRSLTPSYPHDPGVGISVVIPISMIVTYHEMRYQHQKVQPMNCWVESIVICFKIDHEAHFAPLIPHVSHSSPLSQFSCALRVLTTLDTKENTIHKHDYEMLPNFM